MLFNPMVIPSYITHCVCQQMCIGDVSIHIQLLIIMYVRVYILSSWL